MYFRLCFAFFFISFLFIGCDTERLNIDVDGHEPDIRIQRWDRSMFDTIANIEQVRQDLYQMDSTFFREYCLGVLQIGEPFDSSTLQFLDQFRKDPFIYHSYDELKATFKDIAQIESSFNSAFSHQMHYFPEMPVPNIIAYHSGFNFGIYPMDRTLAVGLEFYMGPETQSVQKLHPEVFPQYQKKKMRPEYLVSDAIKGWILVNFQEHYKSEHLLSEIIFYGKMMYLAEAFLPQVQDSLMMNYTSEEIRWVEENQFRIWKELAKEESLFEIRSFEIRKWIIDGPFTSAGNLPQESPSRLGIYIGWQIIRDYMNDNPDVSLSSMIEESDYQKILRFYNPK